VARRRDVAIVGYYETKFERRSGRSIFDVAGEAAAGALAHAGVKKGEVDGVAVNSTLSAAGEPFWSNRVCDALGLVPRWLEMSDIGGPTGIGNVARAASAIRDGWCSTVLVISADTPSTTWGVRYGGYRPEFQEPYGVQGPPGLFGLLQRRYAEQYPLDVEALAKIAVVQREHALLNPNAIFKQPMTREDYFKSRIVSDPLRLLDSVMYCDGGSALVVTTAERAKVLGAQAVHPVSYAEITNFNGDHPAPDITETGFSVVGPAALAQAELTPRDIQQFHPYDDFTIAIVMQLEQIGFCRRGEGSRFVLDTDLSYKGTLPLNTGGGQLSAGQPGLAGGMVNFVEAVRQLRGEATGRQVPNPRNAMVTGIGVVPFIRNWGTSAVMILEV
jgi:acetyl-CoA acetyltransferase